MNLEKYGVHSDSQHEKYEFLSEGPKGIVSKVVMYQKIDHNIYNLAFGDWDKSKQIFSDTARSNNNDRQKILATVAATVLDFTKHHPSATVFVKGSTPARTRLYQMGIASCYLEISQEFDLYGFTKGAWKPFENNRNYEAFFLVLKLKS